MKMGASRAATVVGSVDVSSFERYPAAEKANAKIKYGLAPSDLVCGVVGSLVWTARQSYCYGQELIEALKLLKRTDVSLLIVGDGTGRERLQASVPSALADRVRFTGRIPHEEIVSAINAMDIGFITQTMDELGRYRLTTKLPEYLACGTPVAMSPIPGFFDYVHPAGWALSPEHPASAGFHASCARWLESLTREDVAAAADLARDIALKLFDYRETTVRFRAFVDNTLGAS
jgi:glycosyltransferase involved in cell wall biosynthesis